MTLPFEPASFIVDPDFRLLAECDRGGPVDPERIIESALQVVNNPGDADPAHCAKVIDQLQALLKSGAGKYEGLCHTGIGRCLFRLGRHDEAVPAFEKSLALGSGGPFHRSWVYLRLGCIADLKGKREEALEKYGKSVETGRGHSANLAKKFIDKPYEGYEKDG